MIIPEGYGQVTFEYSGAGTPTGAAWTMGFQNDVDDTPDDIAAAFLAQYVADIAENLSSGVVLTNVHVKLGPSSVGASADLPTSTAGTVADQIAGLQMAFMIKKHTALGGRRGRGRCFIPGVYEGATPGNGIITSGIVTAWNADLASFRTTLGTLGYPLHLLHSENPGGEVPPTPITSLVCDSMTGSVRRRNRR